MESRARQLLQDWHDGQASPLYAAGSSGLVESVEALSQELFALDRNYVLSEPEKAAVQWLQRVLPTLPVVTVAYRQYRALPWAKQAPAPATA